MHHGQFRSPRFSTFCGLRHTDPWHPFRLQTLQNQDSRKSCRGTIPGVFSLPTKPPFLANAALSGDCQKVTRTRMGQYVDSPFHPVIKEERQPAEPGPIGAPSRAWSRWCTQQSLVLLVHPAEPGPVGAPSRAWSRWCSNILSAIEQSNIGPSGSHRLGKL